MSGTNNAPESNQTPADLLAIESAIERLAAAERRAANLGIEERIFAASRATLAVSSAPPANLRFPASGRWRLAAALVLLAGVGMLASIWVASTRIPGAPGPLAHKGDPAGPSETSVEQPINAEDIRDELEELLASYDAVERADLADAAPVSGTFWAEDEGLMTEDPSR